MTEPWQLSSPADVEAAFASADLVPPRPPDTLTPGPAAEVREAMARFARSPDDHGPRREAIERVLEGLDALALGRAAAHESAHRLRTGPIDAMTGLAFTVPTIVLARALGAGDDDVVSDVRAVVGAIGRGEPTTAVTDAATERLLRRFEHRGGPPVAYVSVLYQNHDATAALFAAHVLAAARGNVRRSALARTVREATKPTTIGAITLPAGSTVMLDLERSGFEFGSGAHACPGETIARAIVAGMLEALAATPFVLDLARVEYGDDGRPRSLPLHLAAGQR